MENNQAIHNEEMTSQKVFMTGKAQTLLEWAKRWARTKSLWALPFGVSCCTSEYTHSFLPEYASKGQALEFIHYPASISDLMIIAGPVNLQLLPELLKVYNEMKAPKWVIAMGACAISGGPFAGSYHTVSDLKKHIPIDVFIPGCPPTPEALIHGIECIRECIKDGRQVYV